MFRWFAKWISTQMSICMLFICSVVNRQHLEKGPHLLVCMNFLPQSLEQVSETENGCLMNNFLLAKALKYQVNHLKAKEN